MGHPGRGTRGRGLGIAGDMRRAVSGGRPPGGLTPGRYRVTPRGEVIKLPGKKKKGLRLPKFVNEMLKENLELSKDVRKLIIIDAVTRGHRGGT